MTTEYDFIKACWGQPVDRVPVWLMRQAGRYLQCYKDVRAKGGGTFLDLCKDPARSAAANPSAMLFCRSRMASTMGGQMYL